MFIDSGESFIPFVIAVSDTGLFLAVNTSNPVDHHVYQYDTEFLGNSIFYDSLTDSLTPVFNSYADMLHHIVKIKV
jgi:hypothetical protein